MVILMILINSCWVSCDGLASHLAQGRVAAFLVTSCYRNHSSVSTYLCIALLLLCLIFNRIIFLLATAEQTVKTVVRPVDQPVAGNKRKIESLKIENLMNKMEKVSAIL